MNERRQALRTPVKLFVDHILSEEQHCLCVSEELGYDGMRISGVGQQGWGEPRHVWLQFRLPHGDSPIIRALGELRHDEVAADGRRIRGFSFKYMYPRARRRYEAFLRDNLQP